MGRPLGPARIRVTLRVLPETKRRLEWHAAEAGKPLNVAVDEWGALVQDREDLVAELRRVQDAADAAQHGHMMAMRDAKRLQDRQAAELERYRSRRRGRGRAPRIAPEVLEKIRVRVLEDLARRFQCHSCQGALLVGDLELGSVRCGPCRRALVAELMAG